jgi:hypothetical protein
MYPMIMGLLAAGKIFAWITAETARADQGLDKFLAFSIALIAYVAPYFFLPALFKAAGGVFSNLTGMVNDKGKGLFDKFKGGIDKRKALSNRELGKAQRENLRKINRQARYAQGMTGTGFLAGSRRRIRGGRFGLSSQETRDKMQAGAWGIVTKDQEDTMRGYEAMLNNSYKQLAAAGRLPRVRNARTGALEAQSEGGWLEAQVAGSTGEMRVALLGRMAKTRSFEELRRVHGTFRGIANEGARRSAQGDWLKAIGQNSDALREPAPDIAGSTGDALDYRRMPAASSDSAAKWDMSTWQSLAAVNPAGARAAANRVLTDDRAERLLNDGVRSYLRTL